MMAPIFKRTLGLFATGLLLAATAPARTPIAPPGMSPSLHMNLPVSAAVEAAAQTEPLYLSRRAAKQYHLRMFALHTGESLDVTYRVGNHYVPSGLAMLNHFLRDHMTGSVTVYDPHEFDVLNALMQKLRRPNGVIDIVCGYRTPGTNEYLRETTFGVAEHSQHMQGRAIDIRVPGVSTRRLDRAALALHDGGVGYYPRSHFVHVDVGPVRRWTTM